MEPLNTSNSDQAAHFVGMTFPRCLRLLSLPLFFLPWARLILRFNSHAQETHKEARAEKNEEKRNPIQAKNVSLVNDMLRRVALVPNKLEWCVVSANYK